MILEVKKKKKDPEGRSEGGGEGSNREKEGNELRIMNRGGGTQKRGTRYYKD